MSLFGIFKRKLASVYTNIHSMGGAFEIKGKEANLWVATNPKGDKEYFVIDREICWNSMCLYSRRGEFRPHPDDFVLQRVDFKICGVVEEVKKAWFFRTLNTNQPFRPFYAMKLFDFFKSKKNQRTQKEKTVLTSSSRESNHSSHNKSSKDIHQTKPSTPEVEVPTVDISLKREVDIERIKKTFDIDPEYPNNPAYPVFTHKHSGGTNVEMLWVCENCGFTSFYNYRNDMYVCDEIYYCKKCKTAQCLATYSFGEYKDIRCVVCHEEEEIVKYDGKTCPICGGKVAQFNGIKLKREYVNYSYNEGKASIMDEIKNKAGKK